MSMGFDAVAFAMGKAGASRNLLSALMGGGSGGGGVTLETSGWVKGIEGNASVSGNVITLSSGKSTHSVQISPPGAGFAVGDELVIALSVTENWQRLNLNNQNSKDRCTSSTGFFTQSTYGVSYCLGTGNDIVTFAFTKESSRLSFIPATQNNNGSADAYATIEITGIKYNGTTIFGRV